MRTIVGLVVIFAASTCYGQVVVTQPRHSSTVEEGILRGQADVIRSEGQSRLHTAQAAAQLEVARKQAIENRTEAIVSAWKLQDEWKQRNKGGNGLDALERRLENAQRLAQLRLLESQLVNDGVIVKTPPKVVIEGVEYKSVDEWKASNAWTRRRLELVRNRLYGRMEDLNAEIRHKQSVAAAKHYDGLTAMEREAYHAKRRLSKYTDVPDPKPVHRSKDLERELQTVLADIARLEQALKELGNE